MPIVLGAIADDFTSASVLPTSGIIPVHRDDGILMTRTGRRRVNPDPGKVSKLELNGSHRNKRAKSIAVVHPKHKGSTP